MKINWYLLFFLSGLVVLWFTPYVPYRDFYEGYGPQQKLTAEERRSINIKRDAQDEERAYSEKLRTIGYTLAYGGIALAFAKIIADAVADRKRGSS